MRHIIYRFSIDFYHDSVTIRLIHQGMGVIFMGYGYGYYGIDFTYLVLVIPALLSPSAVDSDHEQPHDRPAPAEKIPRGSFSPPRMLIQSGREKPSQTKKQTTSDIV